MSDLIERQKVIDAMAELQGRASTKAELKGISKAWKRIKQLPPAQPEIIRCKECRHRTVNNHYGERGYLKIKGYCELDTGDPFELGRDAWNDDWFCADAERGEPQHGSD